MNGCRLKLAHEVLQIGPRIYSSTILPLLNVEVPHSPSLDLHPRAVFILTSVCPRTKNAAFESKRLQQDLDGPITIACNVRKTAWYKNASFQSVSSA